MNVPVYIMTCLFQPLPFLLLTYLFINSQAFGQSSGSLSTMLTTLDTFYAKHPIEKIHIHTDKPYYALGDTIWFKTYVVAGSRNVPSQFSGAVYVDLIDPTDSLVQALKLPVMNGLAKGSLTLSTDLNAGNYYIRAYTQWMRNADADFFYQQTFPVADPGKDGIAAKASLLKLGEGKSIRRLIKLHFADNKKAPLENRPVSYTLRTNKRYYTGKGITTDQGELLIDISGKEEQDSIYKIQSSLALNKGNIKQHFKVVNDIVDCVEIVFFPEGGNLVSGLVQRIAVKATGPNGKGIAVNGDVRNSKGESQAAWETQHAGMSVFTLNPIADEKYHALIRFPDGSEKYYDLPSINTGGHSLSVFAETGRDSVLVRLQSTPDAYGPLLLLAQHNGEVVFAEDIDQRRPLTQLYIPKRLFPSGINQFTLFDHTGIPLAERIAFFQQADSLRINVPTIRSSFTRDSMRVNLKVSGRDSSIFTSLSVAVIDENKAPVTEGWENTIFTQLLLRSDLRGYIENPAYYFTQVDQQKRDHLDLLMMTQGYRHFAWRAFTTGEGPKAKFAAEPLLQQISGTLLTLHGKPVKDGKITLFSNRLGVYLDTLTDEHGRFRFDNLLIQDSLAFTLQGRKPRGSDKVEIKLDVQTRPSLSQRSFKEETFASGENLQVHLTKRIAGNDFKVHSSGEHQLDEVEITARGSQYLNIRGVSIPLKQLDHIIRPRVSDSSKTLLECIRLWVPDITFGFVDRSRDDRQTNIRPIDNPYTRPKGTVPINIQGADLSGSGAGNITAMQYQNERLQHQFNNSLPALPVLLFGGREIPVLYNGFPIYGDTLSYLLKDQKAFDSDNIKAIYIKKYGGTGAATAFTDMSQIDTRSFLYIETKDGLMFPPNPRWDYTVVKPQGYSMVREFYSPRYDRGRVEASLADRRSTIYWNPDIRVDKKGQASFRYFNAGSEGIYRVVIEGINSHGQLGRAVFHYRVIER
uniref:Uncharacterized protein n=1 Tax=Sphingobacterium sp. (strain 21) TaxID=743722 RepID=F4C9U1_SPHS2